MRGHSFIFLILLLSPGALAFADEVELVSGGRIEGKVASEKDGQTLVVKTPFGNIATRRSHALNVQKAAPQFQEYKKRAPKTPDTAAAQWELSKWCAENELRKERLPHLRRVVELETNHVQARAALGFSFHDGQWVLIGQRLQEDGYVFIGGKWLSPQDVEVLGEIKARVNAERKWVARTSRLVAMLQNHHRERAIEELLAINDIHALPALVQRYREPNPRHVRATLLRAIENIDSTKARENLIMLTLYEPDEEMAHLCIQSIQSTVPSDELVEKFTELLQSENNFEINRAAWVLGELNATEALPQLISALVSSHVVANARPKPQVVRRRRQPKSVRPEVRSSFPNVQVLNTLNKLSGENFGYDQKKWEGWLAIQQRHKLAAKNTR